MAIVVLLLLSFIGTLGLFSSPAAGQGGTVTGVGPWTEQNNYGSSSTSVGTGGIGILGVSCVTNSGLVYCVGGQNATGTDLSDVFFAQLSPTGSVGAWTETTDYGASTGTSGTGGIGIEWPSCVEYGGYIYCVGGATTGGSIVSKSFYAQLSSSGVGAWTETTDYGAASGTSGSGGSREFQLACVADSGYIYCVGGGTSKVFYAQLSSSGIGPWTETTDYGAASGSSGAGGVSIDSNACVDSNGTIYCVGGTGTSFKPVSDVFSAPLSSSGVGAWTENTDYGASSGTSGSGGVPIYGTNCVVYSSYIICMAGDTTGNAGTSGVYYAQDGSLGVWLAGGAFPFPVYWLNCVQAYGRIYCWGAGSKQGYSAPLQPTTTTSTTSTIELATPSLTTSITEALKNQNLTAATSVTLGYKVFDTAILTGGDDPTGTITYVYYTNGNCSGPGDDFDLVGVDGNGPAPVSGKVLPPSPGAYSFRAEYSGDDLNAPAQSACEPFTVLKATTIIFTVLNPSATVEAGQVFHDSAGFSAVYTPAMGTVTYNWYQGGACGGQATQLDVVNVNSNGTVPASITAAFSAGTYSFQAVYSGDANNNPDTSACEVLTVTAPSGSGPTTTAVSGGGSSTTIYVAVGIAIVVLALLGFLYLQRQRSGKPPPPEQPVAPPPPPPPKTETPVSTSPPPPPENPPIQPVAPENQATENPGCVQKTKWLFEKSELHVFVNKDPGRFLTLPYQSVPMGAWGTDSHLLIHECSCPGIDGDLNREVIRVRADTIIKWKVVEGEGTFVTRKYRIDREVKKIVGEVPWHEPITDVKPTWVTKVGTETFFERYGPAGDAYGGQVIFAPPSVPAEGSAYCKILVTMEHTDYTKDPDDHENPQALIEMWISKRGAEFLYEYRAVDDVRKNSEAQRASAQPYSKGVCKPRHHWRQLKPIEAKFTWVDAGPSGDIALPRDVIYPNKVLVNDYVEIMVSQPDPYFGDMDQLLLDCVPSGEGPCKVPAHSELELSDTLVLSWSADGGDFPLLKARKEWESTHFVTKAVWHAPDKPGDAKISVSIADSAREFIDPPLVLTLDLQVELEPKQGQ
jgi:hypothetical protein